MRIYIFYFQNSEIYGLAINNFLWCLLAIAIICFLFIPSVYGTLLLVFVVVMIDINLIASIYYWGLTISGITVINLIMSIGLVVDYAAHIVHFYLFQNPDLEVKDAGKARGTRESGGEDGEEGVDVDEKDDVEISAARKKDTVIQRVEMKSKQNKGGCMAGVFRFASPLAHARMEIVMVEMAPNVMLGGTSTLLGIMVLSFATSEIFRTFFRMMLATNILGLLHGMILTPVLLSFYVPKFLFEDSSEKEALAKLALENEKNKVDKKGTKEAAVVPVPPAAADAGAGGKGAASNSNEAIKYEVEKSSVSLPEEHGQAV